VSASTSTDRIEKFFHHLASLKTYAKRVVVEGDQLSKDEETDHAARMAEFLDIGASFDLSEKEMIGILYREMFIVK
jgi:hypothetical protein